MEINKKFFPLAVVCCFLLTCCENDQLVEIKNCNYIFKDSSVIHPRNEIFNDLVNRFKNMGYPGFVLSMYDSVNGLWLGAAGQSCIETHEPMDICNLHHSASVSKIYISTAILRLYEQGRLDINALAINYLPPDLPDIANIDRTTVKNLLNHSSGIYDFNNNPKLYVNAINDTFSIKSWKDHLKYVSGKEAVFPPGTSAEYSNTNYLLLGLIIEKVSGKSLGDAINELIIEPCGLNETFYKSSYGYPEVAGIPNSYFEHYKGIIQNCTRLQLHFANVSMGHEGIIASPADYIRFLDKLLGNKILQPETLAMMEDFIEVPGSKDKYGLGLFLFDTPSGKMIGHSGGGFGTMTLLFQLPDIKRTVFFATNLGSIFKSDLSEKFYNEVFYEIVEKTDY